MQSAGLIFESEINLTKGTYAPIDSHGIRRVLSNLVSNACKFSFAESIVRLEVKQVEKDIRFCVEDQGEGIAEEHLNDVFTRSHRGSQSDLTEGSGLGLAIAKEIVERHGGRIGVENEWAREADSTSHCLLVDHRSR